jgi:hypothetical protein
MGHGSHGGMGSDGKTGIKDGIEEMGIMTTNFAWDMPIDMKGTGGASLSGWATPDKPAIPNTSNQPDKTMKVENPKSITVPSPSPSSGSWWSNLFGGSSASPTPTPNTKSAPTPTPTLASPVVSPTPTVSSVGLLAWLFGGGSTATPTPTAVQSKQDVRGWT